MPELDRLALNRALLARQHLLRPATMGVTEAVEHLVGLQAQVPVAPYVGLWSRLRDFDPEVPGRLLVERRFVRTALMRSTIHLVTAEDLLTLRPLVQPVIAREMSVNRTWSSRIEGLDIAAVVAAGRALLDERPRPPAELGKLLQEQWPDRDPTALAYVLRCFAPLVQVPPRGVWGASGRTTYATAETWLGRPLDPAPSMETVILRYLAAFGPAGVADVRTWSGLPGLAEVLDALRPRLRVFRADGGRELFDLPDAPRPEPDIPAPPRFLGEYDNVFLSHADRARVFPDGVSLMGLYRTWPTGTAFRGAFLTGGFLRGVWWVVKDRTSYRLVVAPADRLPTAEATEVERLGHELLGFLAPGAERRDVQIEGAQA